MILAGAVKNSSTVTEKSLEAVFHDLLTVNTGGIVPESVERLGAVAAAHRIFTNGLAALPWLIRQKDGENRKEAEHSISEVLKVRANPYMTPFMAEKILYSRAFWHGVGYAYIERDRLGNVVGLIPIPVEPEITLNPQDGTRWYKFTLPSDNVFGKKLTRSFQESQLFKYIWESYDGMCGRGILNLARETMDTDLKAQGYNNKFYANGARPSGVLEVPGELSEENRETLKREFQNKYSGENAFRVAVLDMGMKYSQLGISQQDAQYIEQRNFTVEEVARFTGIPVHMLQSGKQSYNSNEEQRLEYVMDVLTPPLVQIEQEAMYKFFTEEDRKKGYYLKKNVAAMLRGTHEARANYYQKMAEIGIYNQDEMRALEDMSPIPDGKGQTYWMSKNYAPIDDKTAFGGSGEEVKTNASADEGDDIAE